MFVGTVPDLGFLIVFFFSSTNSTHPSGKGNNLFGLGQLGDLLLPPAGGFCSPPVVPWHLIQTGGKLSFVIIAGSLPDTNPFSRLSSCSRAAALNTF